MSFPRIVFAGLFIAAPILAPAHADDIEASLEAALEAYRAGDRITAKEEADFASTLLGQLKAEDLGAYLPDPLDGWTREDAENTSMGAQVFGGGLISQASYEDGAGARVQITLAADSPMVTAMAAMFANPAALGAMGKITRVGKHKAVVTNQGEVQALIDRRIMVTVSGDAPSEVKEAYFQAIDLDGLADF